MAAALQRQLARDGTHGGGEAHATGEGSPRKSTQLSAGCRDQPPGGWGGVFGDETELPRGQGALNETFAGVSDSGREPWVVI